MLTTDEDIQKLIYEDTSAASVLKSVNTSVSNFIRLEVGEGIEKKEEDFAAEVAAQQAAAAKK